jgi:hypothetical protein
MCDDWGEDENVTKVGPKEDDDWGDNTSNDNNYKVFVFYFISFHLITH